jgi:hypothetical protein
MENRRPRFAWLQSRCLGASAGRSRPASSPPTPTTAAPVTAVPQGDPHAARAEHVGQGQLADLTSLLLQWASRHLVRASQTAPPDEEQKRTTRLLLPLRKYTLAARDGRSAGVGELRCQEPGPARQAIDWAAKLSDCPITDVSVAICADRIPLAEGAEARSRLAVGLLFAVFLSPHTREVAGSSPAAPITCRIGSA